MKKLGVIQIIDNLNTGGAEVMALSIANSLLDEGINSHICVTRQEGKLNNNIRDKRKYFFLDRRKVLDFKAIIKLKKYISKNNISIIHAHSSSFFIAFCVKILRPSIKIIWHDHYGISQQLDSRPLFPLKIISLFFKGIISVNSSLQNWAKDKLLCKKVYFLNNFPIFNNVEGITKLKGEKNKRIIHLAGFREQKDHITLIKAFDIFLRENKDWTLHLVGAFVDKNYYKKILDLINKKDLKKSIFVYGACLDIKYILQQSTIGVLSSKSEGLPLSLLEYGLAKKPVIVTNVGECSNVIINNNSGFVVEANDSQSFAKKMDALANDEKLRYQFSKNHYENVINNYSKKSFIKKIEKIYSI